LNPGIHTVCKVTATFLRERPFNLKGEGRYVFFSKKNILIPNVAEKKYSDFDGGKKKSDSEFLLYNLMWNYGKKFRGLRDKKKNSNSCVVRIKIF
jgi:hypothetical protein